MAKVNGRERRPEKLVKHPFETTPPMQQKFPTPVFGMEAGVTALPVDHAKVNPKSGDPQTMCGKYGRPLYDDLDSDAIHRSTTNGKV